MERTVEGQAVEIGWRTDNVGNLTPVDYLDMILRKTCTYTTILPLRVGALIGSWGSADLDAIALYGFELGAAFQIQDDILNLVGYYASYGKDLSATCARVSAPSCSSISHTHRDQTTRSSRTSWRSRPKDRSDRQVPAASPI